jgi:hypothetical protein
MILHDIDIPEAANRLVAIAWRSSVMIIMHMAGPEEVIDKSR